MYVLYIVVCTFSFGHSVVCSSSIDGLWLPLWYHQTLIWMYRNQACTLYSSSIIIHSQYSSHMVEWNFN